MIYEYIREIATPLLVLICMAIVGIVIFIPEERLFSSLSAFFGGGKLVSQNKNTADGLKHTIARLEAKDRERHIRYGP